MAEEVGISQTSNTDAAGRTAGRVIPAIARESVWKAADGHAIRRIDFAAVNPRGSLLFCPGRGDFYEKYLETLEHWAARGWHVTAIDWRGQALSGRLGGDEVTGHVDDFGTWIADLAGFWQGWVAETPGPHVLCGHSMGGHLALRAVVDGAAAPDALVLSAPMLGFTGPPLPLPVAHGFAKLMTAIGDPKRPAWKWSEKPGEIPAGREKLLTHDDDRYGDEQWWRTERPGLVMGPGSWGWVERAYASVRGLNRTGVLEAVTVPTVAISTSNDKLVSHAAVERAIERMPNATLVRFGTEARHEILREVDGVRDRALGEIDAFLDETLPKQ
ncbi:alpha/beta hydrolase [Alteriqipengyuania flavescens]|uniref:alpha/beta fold hydrolase n=1 Tax=Alteriqipengyuania flavescens TaxID=3053610 RepID=UPI0025B3F067|nr:alpha/beta hydrolase [Alteriqipengyuania flavescens]WJY19116.1 alpha/beta hydrolase [Alteriqipengyuania flavescens]WJY25057.1 alpha/beta hydrolase [Alteriqipengyuania flavescens]